MANTYNWNIKLMDIIPLFDGYENFVTRVYWDYIGINENGVSSKVEGYTEWNVVNKEHFILYGDITLENVISWLEDYNDTNNLQSIISNKIEVIINPPIVNLPFPWIPQSTTTTEPISTTTTTTELTTTTTIIGSKMTTSNMNLEFVRIELYRNRTQFLLQGALNSEIITTTPFPSRDKFNVQLNVNYN